MKKDKLDLLDTFITEVLVEAMNDSDITDEEIEQQWLKLQAKTEHIKVHRKNSFKKAAIIIIGVLAGFTMMNLADSEISAWRVQNIMNILNDKENGSSIEQKLSVGGGLRIVDEEADLRIITSSIEEVRDSISFNFRELPYDLEDASIEGSFDGGEIVDLNYKTNQGRVRLTQMRQGIEFTQSVNVNLDSDITEMKINNTSYSIVKINEERTKVIWSCFGVNHTMDIYYPIEIEEVKELIKAME